MSNNDPGVEITNMTSNLMLKIETDLSIWAKIAGNYPALGTLYLKGVKVTVTSKTFVKIYPA